MYCILSITEIKASTRLKRWMRMAFASRAATIFQPSLKLVAFRLLWDTTCSLVPILQWLVWALRSGLSFKFNVKAFYYIAPIISFSTPSQTSQATSLTWGWHQKSGSPTDTNSGRVCISQDRLCYSMVAIPNSQWPNQQKEFLSLVLCVPPRSAVALLHIVFTLGPKQID